MTTLGLIGSGNIGGTLARLAVAAGIDVVLSNSRGPQTLAELVAELGERARAATPAEAAAAGDIVVVTVPLKAYQDVPVDPLVGKPVDPLVGKVVIDTNNYYPGRDGEFPDLDAGVATSSELLQRHLPRSRVVKAFNNILFKHLAVLARPTGAADRTALPIAGDDTAAKTAAAELIGKLGYDTVDIGSLADSWRTQPDTPVYGTPYAVAAPFWENEAAPADAETVRKAVEAAER
ncbi:NADPH-dependent F420 reductase [Nocardia niigatensis]|uniref:NADPH-dependent F420 reductase n=1 Tax=Nocardia niigatensis TaxID=209249 RepID=UPI00031FF476|nr:NAD(P)-binding domain-containing protein [Nocardia niigatensis]